jgi:hypothetical protein
MHECCKETEETKKKGEKRKERIERTVRIRQTRNEMRVAAGGDNGAQSNRRHGVSAPIKKLTN